ncbi:MAG: excisionase [Microbacterium sp.]|uniref:Excisionase n=1 Tax=Microbacterium ginsengisoli TaxID=400772 RepID=A0A3C1KA60_9MICO|nr:excisionase [Microbacterium sp.]HAN23547.1 excisionase [Microbacterium ginsengisoli]
MTATDTPVVRRRGRRLAVITAVAGTVLIALGAFWLSFTALADLARRSGIAEGQAWAWPLIVDGIIVVATVSVVALAGQRSAWYPWVLLAAGAIVSVTANALHAVVAADADVPGVLAASVAAVPPLVLLAITHLTVILTRPVTETTGPPALVAEDEPQTPAESPRDEELTQADVDRPGVRDRREVAAGLRGQGWSNKRIARHLGVHPSTVGRWFTPTHLPDKQTIDETGSEARTP